MNIILPTTDVSALVENEEHTISETMSTTLTNADMLALIETNRVEQNAIIIRGLRGQEPGLSALDDETILRLYNNSVSIHQGRMQKSGASLEKTLADLLRANDIPFREQVTIDKEGIIVGFNTKRKKCYHVLDVVVGDDIDVGRSIGDFIVVSCKTTCRERWTQDNAWSHTFPPILYILLTTSDDYPLPVRFGETACRQIATCLPKMGTRDTRQFKLGFDGLVPLIRSTLT